MSLHAAIVVRRDQFVLDVELEVAPGSTLAIVGPNGSGKSTVVGAIAGTLGIDVGCVRVGDRVLDDDRVHVDMPARRVGVVFQDYLLFPHLSVVENVAFGPRSRGVSRKQATVLATHWLERFGMASLAARAPRDISGGQAQRVALARALASEPEVLLLDEPLAALDVEVRDDVRSQLKQHLAHFAGVTIVVTHSIDDVTALADRVAVLEGGAITQNGTVAQLLEAPVTAYASRLVG